MSTLPKARHFDLFVGVCVCHCCGPIGMSGHIITFSSVTYTDYRGAARLMDLVLGNCGHIGYIVTASSVVNVDYRPSARLTSVVQGCLVGTIVTGSGVTGVNP